MTDYVLVEYGDLEGGGFVPHVPEGVLAPPAPFTTAAHRLLTNVPQPPDPVDDGHLHPLWSMRVVDVDATPHWCFAVQGRGGAFGQAGMCQFLFVPLHHPAAQVWLGAITLVLPDGRLVHPGIGPRGDAWQRPVSREHLSASLADLFAAPDRVVVDGSPLEVATTIGALLGLVPEAVARQHVWSTCLVRRAVKDDRPVVTGRWPEQRPGGQSGLRSWLKRKADRHGTPVTHPKTAEVVEWLADLGAKGQFLQERYSRTADLDALTALVAAEQLDFGPADVPGLLAAADPRLLSGRGRGLLTEWVSRSPGDAVALLAGGSPLDPRFEEVVFDSLLDDHVHARPGTNPIMLPPRAHGVPGWEKTLVRLLGNRFGTRDQMVEFVRDYLIAPGRPLHGAGTYLAHEEWLTALDVSPTDPGLGIYEVPTPRIVALVGKTGTLDADSRAFLLAAPDTAGEVGRVVDGLTAVRPRLAADLLALCRTDVDADKVLARIVGRGVPGGGPTEIGTWLLELHALVPANRRPVVLGRAVTSFVQHDVELPAPWLALALRAEAAQVDPDSLRHVVLSQSAATLEAHSRKSAPKPKRKSPPTGSGPTDDGAIWHETGSPDHYTRADPAAASSGPEPADEPGRKFPRFTLPWFGKRSARPEPDGPEAAHEGAGGTAETDHPAAPTTTVRIPPPVGGRHTGAGKSGAGNPAAGKGGTGRGKNHENPSPQTSDGRNPVGRSAAEQVLQADYPGGKRAARAVEPDPPEDSGKPPSHRPPRYAHGPLLVRLACVVFFVIALVAVFLAVQHMLQR